MNKCDVGSGITYQVFTAMNMSYTVWHLSSVRCLPAFQNIIDSVCLATWDYLLADHSPKTEYREVLFQ